MNYRRTQAWLLSVLIVALPGCQFLTPQQRDAVSQTIEYEYQAGRLTRAQRDAAYEALDEKSGINWDGVMQSGVNVLMAVLLGTPIAMAGATRRVMQIRGPVATPEERVRRAAAKPA
jgi:hypothetical protein